jgi:hypothetical protein
VRPFAERTAQSDSHSSGVDSSFADHGILKEEETMTRTVILCAAMVIFILCLPVAMSGQDETPNEKITIKSKEINNGVVILGVQGPKNSFELQCNKGATGCTLVDPGEYVMVRLGRNRGLYDCENAEVYKKSAESQPTNKIGQYCLVEATK